MSSYKQAKEGFVSGGEGSSGSDIIAILCSLVLTHFLHRSLGVERRTRSALRRMAVDFAVLVLPLLAIITVLGSRLWTCNLILALSVLATRKASRGSDDSLLGSLDRAVITSPPGRAPPTHPHDPRDKLHERLEEPFLSSSQLQGAPATLRRRINEPHEHAFASPFPEATTPPRLRFHQPFLTVYRAQLMLLTALSILAVDFTIFPRKFAKTESWGISLMDAGVGSFVFSLGIVSALPILNRSARIPPPLAIDLWRSTRRTLPLLILGLVRILFVKGVDYPEHVTEYGVHWNFFFSLSILPTAGVLARRLYEATHLNLALLGVALAVVHQSVLRFHGVQEYVLSSAPRTTLLSANREGLASLPGYVVIYVLGLSAGTYVLPSSPDFLARLVDQGQKTAAARKAVGRQPGKAVVVYCSWTIIWWTLFFLCQGFVSPPSRRLANPTYCFWIAANNMSLITAHCLVHQVLVPGPSFPHEPCPSRRGVDAPSDVPLTFEMINRNGLAIFLFANLLTGLVNLSVHSIYLLPLPAFFLLLSYALLIVLFAWSVRNTKISL
ncbi:hypothetical protein PCANC_09860 [Puccinia coronata f. sp. avenae]|uniref:GPI-anchored wall transfer protein n=1 Tax=Puccinia coronata f. sp. avenae TaxID=200324 RepID=A0A2N5T3X3_9BASI|nr:hypothetical protein PCANC_09860 [Puccinia coronata f. sp. avenae]